jgi:hypothetical protein
MSTKFELMHHALNLAANAKDAMLSSSVGEPDDTTWETAQHVLKQAQQMLPGNETIQHLKLSSKLWTSLRTAMDAVANSLDAADSADRNEAVAARNRRVQESIGGGHGQSWMR